MTKNAQYLSAKEAAETLGISVQTLYAYVSRGLLRSETGTGKSRAKRYHVADINALLARKTYRNAPDEAAQDALRWGMPVMDSAITLIQNGTFYYRGQDVIQLAQTSTFETVCNLLWSGQMTEEGSFRTPLSTATLAALPKTSSLIRTFQLALPLAAEVDLASYDLSATAVAGTGARIIAMLTRLSTSEKLVGSISKSMQHAWAPDAPEIQTAIEAALILCADHELNTSAFTARCIASAGSTPYAVVDAALGALQGFRHGGQTERGVVMFLQAAQASGVRQTLEDYLRRGETIPGFRHKLYPNGDPRSKILLALTKKLAQNQQPVEIAVALEELVFENFGWYPNLDFGLVVMCQALQLPPHAAIALFAVGRTAGWIGHAIEQYELNTLIRPRARYVGKHPSP